MKPNTVASAGKAAKFSLVASSAFIVAPIIVHVASGIEVTGGFLAQKLVIGIFLFPVIFLVIWAYRSARQIDIAPAIQSPSSVPIDESPINNPNIGMVTTKQSQAPVTSETMFNRPSPWNYVMIAVGVSMLLFMFLPVVLSGNIATQHYLSAAFWVGVIAYCAMNIKNASRVSS